MDSLRNFLATRSESGLVSLAVQQEARSRFGLSLRETEEQILSLDLLPIRYARNRNTFTTAQQRVLLNSRVAVFGCGGLGGYIVEELARLGVGSLLVVDPDVFDEHNLNRQLLALPGNLGMPKAVAAVRRVQEINPAVQAVAMVTAFSEENGEDLLLDVKVAADALDNIPARLALARFCDGMGVPLVHGSVGGWFGTVATQYPGENTIQRIYAGFTGQKGIEEELGNTSFTPALVASIEVAEITKILLGEGTTLRGRLLSINLIDMEIVDIDLRQ
jgi:molybdopterin/thiamine biosynthesis adenylyltransferase